MSVYFITCRKTGTVKIGSSLEPHARLKELQTGHPFELKLEAVLPGGTDEEFGFHRRFSDERLKGEWFRVTEMIELIIKNNPAGAPPDHDKTAREQRARLGHPAKIKFESAIQEARVTGAWPQPKRRPAFSTDGLSRDQKKRVASGDIHFPFRGKTYA